jgi:hypothetical protein
MVSFLSRIVIDIILLMLATSYNHKCMLFIHEHTTIPTVTITVTHAHTLVKQILVIPLCYIDSSPSPFSSRKKRLVHHG